MGIAVLLANGSTALAPPAGLTEHDATMVWTVVNEIVPDTLTAAAE